MTTGGPNPTGRFKRSCRRARCCSTRARSSTEGGENRSEEDRWGLNITDTLSWLRTEENQYLSCPPDIARDLDPDLQELLGYTMGNYALGYYSDPHEVPAAADLRPPELALGRKPRRRQDGSALLSGDAS